MRACNPRPRQSQALLTNEQGTFPELDAFCLDLGFTHWSFYHRPHELNALPSLRSNLPPPWQLWTNSHLAAIFEVLKSPRFEAKSPFCWDRAALQRCAPVPERLRMPATFLGISASVVGSTGDHSVFTVMRDKPPLGEKGFGQVRQKLNWMAGLLHRAAHPELASQAPALLLTPRQVEVMRLTVAGMTAQQISNALNVSRRTVRFHQERAMAALNATNITAAAFQAGVLGVL